MATSFDGARAESPTIAPRMEFGISYKKPQINMQLQYILQTTIKLVAMEVLELIRHYC